MLAATTINTNSVPKAARVQAGRGDDRAAHLETLYRLTDRLYRARRCGGDARCRNGSHLRGPGLRAVLDPAVRQGGRHALRCMARTFGPLPDDARRPHAVAAGHRGPAADLRRPTSSRRRRATTSSGRSGPRTSGASPSFRLTAQGKVIGKFMAYHRDAHVYNEAQKALAITVARQIGFSLERAQTERHG